MTTATFPAVAREAPGRTGPASLRPVLLALDEGRLLGAPLTWALRAAAVCAVVAGVVVVAQNTPVSLRIPGVAAAGGILHSIVFLVTTLGVAQVVLHRARSIAAVEHAPFVVVPTVSNLARLAGETCAVLHAGVGIAGALWAWTSGATPMYLLGTSLWSGVLDRLVLTPEGLEGLPGPWAGAAFLGASLLIAYVALVASYFVAEQTVVLVFVASHARRICRTTEAAAGAPHATADADAAPARPGAGARAFCTHCGARRDEGAAGCRSCGR